MRYIRFEGGNGYCGCDFVSYMAFKENFPEREIDIYATELAISNAECYEFIIENILDEDEYNSDEERQEAHEQIITDYYSNAWCSWEEISLKKYLENREE